MSGRPNPATLLLVLGLSAGSALCGQTPGAARDRLAAMQPFERWIGSWKGSGWSMDATGRRTDFELVESVIPKVGGTVLSIEGRGASVGDNARTTHDGLVLLYYDDRVGVYRWNGHEIGSGSIDAEPRLVDGGFEWSIRTGEGGASIRFTIRFDDTRWHEVGEVSMDGSHWGRFMEIELKRVN